MRCHAATIASAAILAAPASVSVAQAPQNLPPSIRAGHAQAVHDCRAIGGRLSVWAGYISRADFNADGMPDYILDLSKLQCSASASMFCGSRGCGRDIYVSRSNGFYPVSGVVVNSAKVVTRAGKTLLHVNEDDGAGGKYWGSNGSKIDIVGTASRASESLSQGAKNSAQRFTLQVTLSAAVQAHVRQVRKPVNIEVVYEGEPKPRFANYADPESGILPLGNELVPLPPTGGSVTFGTGLDRSQMHMLAKPAGAIISSLIGRFRMEGGNPALRCTGLGSNVSSSGHHIVTLDELRSARRSIFCDMPKPGRG